MQSIHFIGIGGIGMSSLARYYIAKGWRVTGSDVQDSDIIAQLKKIDVDVAIGHRALNIPEKADRVVHSAAIQNENPELEQARLLGIQTLRYAEALGELTRQYITVAVAGAHGKSTTTALLSLMLIAGGLDPTVIIGTQLKEFGGTNFRLGKSRYLVIEADEYDRSFLHYYPTIAIVTNIDREHLDTYGSLEQIVEMFAKFFNNVSNVGTLVVNGKDENIKKAIGKRPVIVFGNAKFKKWPLKISGVFNQLNAEAAYLAAHQLGVSRAMAQKAVAAYHGSWRRMEPLIPKRKFIFRQGSDRSRSPTAVGQKFFSDYAHHPTEIRATINAFQERFPRKKIVIVFQAHQLDRLNRLFDDFVGAFDMAHFLILLPEYRVAGRESSGVKTTKDLHRAIVDRSVVPVQFVSSIGRALVASKITNSVVVFMGAGDIDAQVRKYFRSKLF